MSNLTGVEKKHKIKEPHNLSPRIKWLRDYYFQGTDRAWNNENTVWSTGTPWDIQYNELTYYIVPEAYNLLSVMKGGIPSVSQKYQSP